MLGAAFWQAQNHMHHSVKWQLRQANYAGSIWQVDGVDMIKSEAPAALEGKPAVV
jgi:hypothetical protein